MENTTNSLAGTGDPRKKIVMVAAAIMALMVLFPPKYAGQQLLGQTTIHSAGYQFILSDPAGAEKSQAAALPDEVTREMFPGGVEYGKLFLQLAVLAGLAIVASIFAGSARSRYSGLSTMP